MIGDKVTDAFDGIDLDTCLIKSKYIEDNFNDNLIKCFDGHNDLLEFLKTKIK